MKVDYPTAIRNNYLKILTNVYYLNCQKVQVELVKKFGNYNIHEFIQEFKKAVNNMYAMYLPYTRLLFKKKRSVQFLWR